MIASLFHPSSYLGIFAFMVSTGCGMPLPEEVPIVIAGVLSAAGHLRPELALAAALAGALVGDSILYYIGYRWGGNLLSAHPAFAKLLHAERDPRFEQALTRHSLKVMFLARFMVGIRGPMYLTAGAIRLPYRKFLLFDLICATVVVSFFFALAYFYGDAAMHWIRRAEWTATVLVLLIVVTVGTILYNRNRHLIMQTIFGSSSTPDS